MERFSRTRCFLGEEKFDALNRAVVLNRDVSRSSYVSPLRQTINKITRFGSEESAMDVGVGDEAFSEGFFGMFTKGGAAGSQKTNEQQVFVQALKEGGFTGQDIADMEKITKSSFTEQVNQLGGSITGMYAQLGGPKNIAITGFT